METCPIISKVLSPNPHTSTNRIQTPFTYVNSNIRGKVKFVAKRKESSCETSAHPPRKSKVREYIRCMKKQDEESKTCITKETMTTSNGGRNFVSRLNLSLEDLYLGEESEVEKMSPETANREIRKSLRMLKEKDMVILKLREACQELSLKFADAENRMDEMRFGGAWTRGLQKSKSELQLNSGSGIVETKEQGTETNQLDVLTESCSSWMEKVKNWKTESLLNVSADADSGFRGSDLVEQELSRRISKFSPHETAQVLSTMGNNQDQTSSLTQKSTRSQSFSDIHWPVEVTKVTNQAHHRPRLTLDHFKTLEPLLDDATALARRVQKKSRILTQLIQSKNKKV